MLGYHSFALSPSFLIARLLTHSPTRSLTLLPVCPPARPLPIPITQPPTPSPTRVLSLRPAPPPAHFLPTRSPTRLRAHRSPTRSRAHPLTHPLAHARTHLCTHPIARPPDCMPTCLHAPPAHLPARLDVMEMWHDWATFNLTPSCSVCFYMPHPTRPRPKDQVQVCDHYDRAPPSSPMIFGPADSLCRWRQLSRMVPRPMHDTCCARHRTGRNASGVARQ